jgi:uncharacterized cupredoxin-like copper-binding protein
MKHLLTLGLFLTFLISVLTACGSTAAAVPPIPSGYTEVQITLSDYKIQSSLTSFTAGKPYYFVITNKGAVTHEFMIMPPGMGGHIKTLNKMSFSAVENIAAGETKTLEFTFEHTAAPQQLEFSCHYADHYARGMMLPVVVD